MLQNTQLRFLVLAVMCLLCALETKGAENTLVKKLDAIFAPLADGKSPGAAVLVRKGSQTIYEQGYGLRDLRTNVKIDAMTNFRLASCSKQFTAMAIMLLVHDGKLRYDESLTEIFPDFPAYGKTITVRHLLNHTSGLRDYEDLMEEVEKKNGPVWNIERQIHDREVFDLLKKETSGIFPAGTKWAYSNSGYVMLGVIVAKISGKPYREFLHERIFSPLKMNHTLAYQKGTNEIPNRAYGHTKKEKSFEETDQSSTSATLGDGGIYSNTEDLAKWDDALRNHTLLTTAEIGPALTPVKIPGDATPILPDDATDIMRKQAAIQYGFGWFLDPYKGHQRMWHYGDTLGFHTYIVRFPTDDLTIVVLCNRTDLNPESLALQVADTFLNDKN